MIADDQALIRGGLRAILLAEPDIDVVGEAADGAAAAKVAGTEAADVVLMDIQMPGTDGIEGVRRIAAARPQAKVLVLTMFDLDEYVFAALQAGASGFLLKTTPPDMLAAAIRACHLGERIFAGTVTRRLIDAYVHQRPIPAGIPPALRVLTEREMDVFRAMALGLTNSEIAAKLYMGEATVKTHVTRILAKLGLRDRIHAVLLAYESGLIGR
ncbi:response regulator transcription factor [Paenarthrobacter sp. PH39-S1]|uniref:response regulator transcription factor n=1 Tax=Paenarthrobacter sp. PH39-S1 TaxID=3046204 RepID=UPI0024BA36C8|nr:response regulator transcription factor [Paenarthrobacter sp. PH39-S1]MDJ0357946.1 response regulator transcription factor [Paenarthrobacter sp. PH39-S1]